MSDRDTESEVRSDWWLDPRCHFGEPSLEDLLANGPQDLVAATDFLATATGITSGAAILDLCCGPGHYSVELSRRGFDVVGVDINEGYVDLARKLVRDPIYWLQRHLHIEENTFLIILAVVVGLLGGFGAICFRLLIDAFQWLTVHRTGIEILGRLGSLPWWTLLLAPAMAVAGELKPGDDAPAFSLPGSDGKTHTLSDYAGKTVVVAWFPKAFTGG